MVLTRILEFKNDHPVNYWVRLLCVSFSAVFLLLWADGLFVSADTYETGTGHELDSDSTYFGTYWGGNTGKMGRQMNGTLWIFYHHKDTADVTDSYIAGKFSTDNGGNWSFIKIIDNTWPGFEVTGYPSAVYDVAMLSNNSIIISVGLFEFDTATKPEIHVLCHWNNTDLSQWERVTIYSNNAYTPVGTGIAVNSTDHVLITYYRAAQGQIHYDIFHPGDLSTTDRTKGSLVPGGQEVYAWCNDTDVFMISYDYNAGAGAKSYLVLADGTWSQIQVIDHSGGYWGRAHILTHDNTFVVLDQVSTYTSFGWLTMRYANDTGDGFRKISSTARKLTWAVSGVNNLYDDYVSFMAFDIAASEFYYWAGRYYKSEGYWQGTETLVFDETEAPTVYNWAADMPKAYYPYLESNHTQLPHSLGLVTTFYEKDADGYYDTHELHGTTDWPGVLGWTYDPPSDPEPEPGDGNETNMGAVALWWSDAGCISAGMVAMIIVLVAVLIISDRRI